jgi:hypothetical protein
VSLVGSLYVNASNLNKDTHGTTPFLKSTLFAGNTTQKEINCPRVFCNILSFNGPADLSSGPRIQLLQIENFELMLMLMVKPSMAGIHKHGKHMMQGLKGDIS